MKSLYAILLLMGLSLVMLGCESGAINEVESPEAPSAVQNNSPVTEWHIGTNWTCGLPEPGLCPLVAQAANGHTIEMLQNDGDGARFAGGALSPKPKSASGSGTFVHKDADGAVVATGSWTATELISFVDWGQSPVFCGDGFPLPELCYVHAGRAHISVNLVADNGAEFTGILRVTCLVPGIHLPTSYAEGVRLNVNGGLNFNKEISGGTAFIE